MSADEQTTTASCPVTIAGSFGFGNAGDEAVPLAIADLADALDPALDVRVLSRYDAPDASDVIGLGPQDAARRAELAGAPMLFIGGGVLEPKANAVLFRCMNQVEEINPSGVAIFGANVESGVPFNWRWRRRTRRTLGACSWLGVRDASSHESLTRIMPNADIAVTGDVVLGLRADIVVPSSVASLDRFIAVTLAPRWSDSPRWRSWIARELVRLARHLDAHLVFVPMSVHHDDDRTEHAAVAQAVRTMDDAVEVHELQDAYDPRALAAIFGAASLVVGMRLHTCVLAVSQNVPCIMLAYHPKLIGFARTIGHEAYCRPASVDARQSAQHYGYRFEETSLTDVHLVDIADHALEHATFHRVEEIRAQLATSLADALQHCGASVQRKKVEKVST